MSSLWTIVILQGISTLILLLGILANYFRVMRMRQDLLQHRVRLEQSLAHVEAELHRVQNGRSNGTITDALPETDEEI